jgi:ribosomal protein S18 acetylase RimI-like enzyme
MEKIEDIKISRRPATEKDTEFARQVHHNAFRDVVIRQFGAWDEQVQDKFFESAWKNGLNHEIIIYGNQPCGYGSYKETGDAMIFHSLAILPEFQGRGIGTRILNERIEEAKKKKIPARFQVLKANRAMDLYKNQGAKITGETETHFIMEFDPEYK